MFGVNTAESPNTRQLPATSGVSTGIGVPAESGAENVTVIGWLPSACWLPAAGDTDITRNGPPRVTPPMIGALAGGGPPPVVSMYIPMPASRATTAVTAITMRDRGWPATRKLATPEPSAVEPAAASSVAARPAGLRFSGLRLSGLRCSALRFSRPAPLRPAILPATLLAIRGLAPGAASLPIRPAPCTSNSPSVRTLLRSVTYRHGAYPAQPAVTYGWRKRT